MAVYRIAKDSLFLTELPMYGEKRLGVMKENRFLMKKPTQNSIAIPVIVTAGKPPSKTSIYTLGKKHYETTDRLGNVRVIYTDKKSWQQNKFALNVSSSQDYYPFGSVMEGRGLEITNYRFGYSGHEKIDEVQGSGNVVDMGDRWLDVRIGRTSKVDRKAHLFSSISPYTYALNTPLQAIDPDGQLVIFVNGYRPNPYLFFDPYPKLVILRTLYRFITEEQVFKKDVYEYWGKVDNNFMKRIGDYNVLYADASSHGLSTAMYRYWRGMEAGETILKLIKSGELKLETDANGNVIETIKIVSHSQGGAYAAGISDVLTAAGYTVEVEYYIAPKQPEDIPQTKAQRRVHYYSPDDFVAPQEPMKNSEHWELPEQYRTLRTFGGHSLPAYEKIFETKRGAEGYVAPRKDKPEKPKSKPRIE